MTPAGVNPTLSAPIATRPATDRDLLAEIGRLEARFDAVEPWLMAFVPEDGRFARLRHEAQALLERYPNPESRPPLFGLLVGVKDIFHVEGFVTSAGSRLPPELLQGREATSVTALRWAGALIAGKTATTEFAYFGPGPTRNPHQPEHTPGGSSSGSAAAVAAGLCALALGTQTIGSINRPAAYCGVAGFKPSRGRISTEGVIPLAPSLDHVGLFAANVDLVARAAAQLCAGWRETAMPSHKPVLGIPAGPYLEHADPDGSAQFHADCERLAAAGYTLKRVDALPDFDTIRHHHLLLVAAEAAQVHAGWFPAHEALYHPKTAELIRAGQQTDAAAADRARAYRATAAAQCAALMDAHDLDLWVTPSAKGAAPRGLESTGDPIMNLPWTYAGLPSLTIPTGQDANGLPLALQLVGRFQADEALLQYGAAIEAIYRADSNP